MKIQATKMLAILLVTAAAAVSGYRLYTSGKTKAAAIKPSSPNPGSAEDSVKWTEVMLRFTDQPDVGKLYKDMQYKHPFFEKIKTRLAGFDSVWMYGSADSLRLNFVCKSTTNADSMVLLTLKKPDSLAENRYARANVIYTPLLNLNGTRKPSKDSVVICNNCL